MVDSVVFYISLGMSDLIYLYYDIVLSNYDYKSYMFFDDFEWYKNTTQYTLIEITMML